ncbi:MAG TPA: hypothetical protein VG709_07435 [Actinomycetota bacterium]|nr:hypothetical protein [Actinomycetota bacterium]
MSAAGAGEPERPYRRAHFSEVPTFASDLVEAEWKPVRHHFGVSAFGTNAYVARGEGELLIEEHAEGDGGHEELYVVLDGEARFTVDGESFAAPAGTLVFVPPPLGRAAVAAKAGTAVLAVGAIPGAAFEVSRWEAARTVG